ncbi:IS3 family transposase [Glutamicibacter sp. 287]|uniref:IS3 family transposase n=1 Tax=unclassified Glutamicibacter TaxID=2627139 RepID=UPI0040345A1F
MPKNTYTAQFKADAVHLYESHPDLGYTKAAEDLGIARGTLKTWVRQDRIKRGAPTQQSTGSAQMPDPELSAEQRLLQAQAENQALRERNKTLESANSVLAEERDILRKATKYFGGRDELVIRFQFVEDYRDTHAVKRICVVLGLNRSSYYKWRAARPARAARGLEDQALLDHILRHYKEWNRTLGYRRMSVELACDPRVQDDPLVDGPVNHKRVARLMRENNLVGVHLRRPKSTTVRDPGAQVFKDLVNRDFTSEEVGSLYVGDITYLPYGKEGRFLYLATVLDVCSRRLVGWSIADHMRTDLVVEALESAAVARGSVAGARMHTDHGVQYTSSQFQSVCRRLGVVQSMGRIGSSADNAMAESFNATLKRETLQGAKRWDCEQSCRAEVFRWIVRYNNLRKHSALGYKSPVDFEGDFHVMMDFAA